jgi:hypothetical protein
MVNSSIVLPSADRLTEKEFKLYGNLDCNNPNVIARFVWNYSDFLSQKNNVMLMSSQQK